MAGSIRKLRQIVQRDVAAGLAVCSRCGLRIDPGEPWDLGHADDDRPDRARAPPLQPGNEPSATAFAQMVGEDYDRWRENRDWRIPESPAGKNPKPRSRRVDGRCAGTRGPSFRARLGTSRSRCRRSARRRGRHRSQREAGRTPPSDLSRHVFGIPGDEAQRTRRK
jgi:hypothetical protein